MSAYRRCNKWETGAGRPARIFNEYSRGPGIASIAAFNIAAFNIAAFTYGRLSPWLTPGLTSAGTRARMVLVKTMLPRRCDAGASV